MDTVFYKLTDEQQLLLAKLFSEACSEKDITTGFAAVQAKRLRNVIHLLEQKHCSHASSDDLAALAHFLGLEDRMAEILEGASLLSGASLKIAHQLDRSQSDSGATLPAAE